MIIYIIQTVINLIYCLIAYNLVASNVLLWCSGKHIAPTPTYQSCGISKDVSSILTNSICFTTTYKLD